VCVLQKVSEQSVFDDVIQDVSGRCRSIDLPWLDVEIGLANIKQNYTQPDDKCKQSAKSDRSHTVHVSTAVDTSQSAIADYSHLYIYKKDTNTTASLNRKVDDYIALSSSSSSDEDENECQPIRVADVGSDNDAVTVSSTAVADSTTSTRIHHAAKHSQLYRSPNTGVQVAKPNKRKRKMNKKRS